mmetsp:Transcript_22663/g.33128  ORF Transcript_22663/g.33128 Transcript_22663/m.33128 type:complete len:153 (+) Transcript_22663:82-540(+)
MSLNRSGVKQKKGNMTTSGKLSDRFAKIQASKKVATQRVIRRTAAAQRQNTNRQRQAMQKRGIVAGESRPIKKAQSNRTKPGGKKGGARGKNNKNGTGAPTSTDDLDMEMDSYWFAGGKGPNPVVAALDKDMDAYFESKTSHVAAATTESTA